MQFTFSLDGYHGASAAWTIVVPMASAADLADRVYGMRLQAESAGYPIGQIKARHLGSDACEYDVESLANILTPSEQSDLDRQALAFVEQESQAFARESARLSM